MENNSQKELEVIIELLRTQIIVQLGLSGLPQQQIREIVGVDIYRVNRIVKHFKKINK